VLIEATSDAEPLRRPVWPTFRPAAQPRLAGCAGHLSGSEHGPAGMTMTP
jgi:hypothetical protein